MLISSRQHWHGSCWLSWLRAIQGDKGCCDIGFVPVINLKWHFKITLQSVNQTESQRCFFGGKKPPNLNCFKILLSACNWEHKNFWILEKLFLDFVLSEGRRGNLILKVLRVCKPENAFTFSCCFAYWCCTLWIKIIKQQPATCKLFLLRVWLCFSLFGMCYSQLKKI